MFQSVKRYIKFIAENKMSQQKFLFLYLIRRKDYESIKIYMEAFPTHDGSMIGEAAKQELIDEGFIEKVGESTKVTDYVITEKFNKLFLNNYFEAAYEVWDAYPAYVRIDGKNIPLTNMDKYAFANLYGERIDYSVDEHLEVIKDIRFGVEHNLISSNIEKFVRSQSWEKLREIRLRQKQVKVVSNLNQTF